MVLVNSVYGEFEEVTENPKIQELLQYLPKTVKKVFYEASENLQMKAPPDLTHLTISGDFGLSISGLPTALTFLAIQNTIPQPIENLPPNLTHLDLGHCNFNQPLKNLLPPNLKYLRLGSYFHQDVDNLPASLIYLRLQFEQYFGQNIVIPDNLQFLKIQYIIEHFYVEIKSLGR